MAAISVPPCATASERRDLAARERFLLQTLTRTSCDGTLRQSRHWAGGNGRVWEDVRAHLAEGDGPYDCETLLIVFGHDPTRSLP